MLREPTTDDLMELEIDLELESLLTESVEKAAKLKALKARAVGKYDKDLPPIDYTQADHWVTDFTVAMFVEHHCACGCTTRHFSHFSARQHFSRKTAGKPNRWTKVESRPQVLCQPRLIVQQVPVCDRCYCTLDAIPFHAEVTAPTQLSLF